MQFADLSGAMGQLAVALINVAIGVGVPTIMYVVAKWIRAHQQQAQALVTRYHLELIRDFVRMGISAAEQKFQSADGQAKKDYALKVISDTLKSRGIPISGSQLDAEIEDAVKLGLHLAAPSPSEPAPLGFETSGAVTSPGAVSANENTASEVEVNPITPSATPAVGLSNYTVNSAYRQSATSYTASLKQ